MTNSEQEKIWREDSKNWKMGFFYFNKKDKRIFVDKPNPEYGITINFANSKSMIIIVISILFFGFIVYMITQKQ